MQSPHISSNEGGILGEKSRLPTPPQRCLLLTFALTNRSESCGSYREKSNPGRRKLLFLHSFWYGLGRILLTHSLFNGKTESEKIKAIPHKAWVCESLICLPSVPFYLHLLSEDVYLASQSSLNPRQEILKPSEAGWWYISRFSSQSATEPKSSMNKTVFLPRCYGLNIVWGMSLKVSCVWNLECKNLTCL